jgi:hypothetical protein
VSRTLGGGNSVCRGFFDRHKTTPLQIAERLRFVTWFLCEQNPEAEADRPEVGRVRGRWWTLVDSNY